MRFALHPEAVEDLDEIQAFIGSVNPDAGDRILGEIFATFESLSRLPNQGHRRPDLTSRPLRFMVVRKHLIAYAPEQHPFWIVAVIDGRRSPRVLAAMLRGRE